MPSVEIVEVFTPSANFMLIPITHEIRAARDVKISQNMFNVVNEANKCTTLDPTKHPPDDAATHPTLIPAIFDLGRFPAFLSGLKI